jgi:NRAMP (natural resistance-associated macrophage protein)-like metal ion transporter
MIRRHLGRTARRRLVLYLSIMGPGLITACADNDAGGVATYSLAGAHYGYSLLWMLFLITFVLALVQEMCARMGAVTQKGLAELIREEFGVRWTTFALGVMFVANLATTVAEFAGIAASMEILGISKYLSVPLAGLALWFLVVKGTFRTVERVFLVLCLFFVTYVISGFEVHPPWPQVIHRMFVPSFHLEPGYVLLFIATIGTTITPWMQFFLQSTVVDKGIKTHEYRYERLDVFFGAFVTDFVAFFIIVATAATLYVRGISIEDAQDAALALAPIAGRYCELLFAIGLFNASFLAAAVLPLSTAYTCCEAFGWEMGLRRRPQEAPVFYAVYTITTLLGAGIVLLPRVPLLLAMLVSQDINGILLPVVLIFMLLLVNNKRIMGDYTNSAVYNVIAWGTVGALILLSLLLVGTSLLPGK